MSVAQAGPFGLESGMTINEIFDAGFEFDKEKVESIQGEKLYDGFWEDYHSAKKIVFDRKYLTYRPSF